MNEWKKEIAHTGYKVVWCAIMTGKEYKNTYRITDHEIFGPYSLSPESRLWSDRTATKFAYVKHANWVWIFELEEDSFAYIIEWKRKHVSALQYDVLSTSKK